MKKLTILLCLLALTAASVYSKPIDESTAKTVALNFYKSNSKYAMPLARTDLRLSYTESSKQSSNNGFSDRIILFYIFNVDQSGFVIISGDDNVSPILAYSNESSFDPNNIPPNVRKWLEGYKKETQYIIEKKLAATPTITNEWDHYINSPEKYTPAKIAASVNPLITTKWDQSPYYNALCPLDARSGERTVTGCVATAMAQIMKYWNYPATGFGFHSYNHSKYGTLSANFGSASYKWSEMPNMLNSNNTAVATLMLHCGVSVDMDYGIGAEGGSGAYVTSSVSPVQHCSEYALKTYFGYKSTLKGVLKSAYSEQQWANLLMDELNANRPVLYAGTGQGGGHCFVCDGYDNNGFFHFNWGWSGYYDGFFKTNALNPSGIGTGGGTGSFNSYQQIVIGIEPPSNQQELLLTLNDNLIPSAGMINYGQGFSVSTNIANKGKTNFNGDYCAAIFDEDLNFIDFVKVLSGYSLQAGYTYQNNLVFDNAGLLSMLPGVYYIAVFYRPTSGNWSIVENTDDYLNIAQIQVVHPNSIELNSDITVNPGLTLIQGRSMSVNLNILNHGGTTFYGQYAVALYNLDGSLAQLIGTMSEENGLPAGYTYNSPYLTFNSSSVDVEQGTYLLAVLHNYNNSGWQLTGSTYHQNPIKVTVQLPSLSPDKYEPNNKIAESYTLPITFSNNKATPNTEGSNVHIGTDNDFYKIVLPAGYNYTITGRLHDAQNSGNGNIYSVDAIFSYSTDGNYFSEAFDDVMLSNIKVKGPATVYFRVAPYFSGETGSYLLDLSIFRTAASGIDEDIDEGLVNIFPNPSIDYVNVDLNQNKINIYKIDLLNLYGQIINSLDIENMASKARFNISNLADGVYYLRFNTNKGSFTKRVIKCK